MNLKNFCGTYKKFTPSVVFNRSALYIKLGVMMVLFLTRSALYGFKQFTKKVKYTNCVIELRKI